MGAQAKGSAKPSPDESELKARMLNNIRVGLVFRDRTTGDLGEHMEWNDATRSRKLNGHREIPALELLKVAQYLRIALDDLFRPQDQFITVIAKGMSREELLRKLAQSACWGVVDPMLGQGDLFDAALPPPELEVIVNSSAG